MPADGSMSPELSQTPESPLKKWGNELKTQITRGEAAGSVSDHSNFSINNSESGNSIKAVHDKGNYIHGEGKILLGGVTKETEKTIRGFVGKINSMEDFYWEGADESPIWVTVAKPVEMLFSPKVKDDSSKLI